MFEEKYNELSVADKNQFSSTVNKLLQKGFIVRDVFDSKEKIMRVGGDYRYIERNFDIINDYLSYSSYRIEMDATLGVVALLNYEEENRLKMDRDTSLVLFALRLIYENEKEESNSSTSSVYITTPVLVRNMLEHGIFMPGKKLSGRGIAKCLRFLASHNIINKVSGNYDEGNVAFYILPSIVYALDNEKIRAMSLALDELNKNGELENETTEEN